MLLCSLTFSKAASTKPCSVAAIHAINTLNLESFRTQGIGVVFKYEDNLHILTPAHVVEGAQQILLQCESNQKVQSNAEIFKIDLEADLAILKIRKQVELWSPLFDLSVRNSNLALSKIVPSILQSDESFQKMTSALLPDNGLWQEGMVQVPGVKIDTHLLHTYWVEQKTNYWPAFNSMLYIYGLGVVPGMSGAPLFSIGKNGGFSGIIVKTEHNGIRSLAIPAHQILRWIKTALSNNHSRIYSIENIEFRYRYQKEGHELQRLRSLILKDSQNKYLFQEQCSRTSWLKTSGSLRWSDVSSGSWGDGSGQQKSQHYSGLPEWSTPLSLYRNMSTCVSEGLITEHGERIVAAQSKTGRIYSIQNFEDLILFRQLEKIETDLLSYLRTNKKLSNYSLLCSGHNALFPLSSRVGFTKGQSNKDKSFVVNYNRVFRSADRKSKSLLKCLQNGSLVLTLDESTVPSTSLEYFSSQGIASTQGKDHSLIGQVTFDDQRLRGTLVLYKQTFNFDVPRINFWSHKIDVSQGILLIELSTGERALHVAFSPKEGIPLPWLSSKIWLREVSND